MAQDQQIIVRKLTLDEALAVTTLAEAHARLGIVTTDPIEKALINAAWEVVQAAAIALKAEVEEANR